ncbi:hypothetical protein CU254_27620 [Amycolatopsis sp. AA4]|uniref:hypothetical protein n=1 Tax=Actinomycetes TaxID=1760 RepID=UPI0001B575BD|nr:MULTISPECIES: hypothetical protein [Actinomycetes]ATY13782.1 hypothetical protein CU254_27620 [Amycolatopsis sp. AA4]EFL09771.1 predicted protein [Streptomyces sp. AA4]
METSRHNRPSPSATADGRPAVASGGTLSDLGRLIDRAESLRFRAPELSLVLGERSAALAEAAGADGHWIRAEALVVSARVRTGARTSTVGRAVAALRAAEHAGYATTAARLRVDLAICARSLGVPLMGLAALRPVLSEDVPPSLRAEALCHLVGCLAQFGRKAELDRVLVEADRLLVADDSLDADDRLLMRALLRNGTAAHRRRNGDLTAAADAARTGLGFLEKMDRPGDDGGLVRIRLVLQLVSTLLDRGDADMAYDIAEPVLREPVRAAGVAPAAWLRLAVATRIHLPAGAGDAAAELVREAVAATDRHGLAAVTARLWLELAQIEERFGSAEEAIGCLHRARAAEHVHARARRQACGLIAGELGGDAVASMDLDDVLAASAPRDGRPVSMEVEPRVAAEETSVMPAIRDVPAERPDPVAAPLPVVPAQVEVPVEPVSASGWVEAAEKKPAWSFRRAAAEAEVEQTSVLPAIRETAEEAPRTGGRRRAEDRKAPVLPGWARPFGRKSAEAPAPRKQAPAEPVGRAEAASVQVAESAAGTRAAKTAEDAAVRRSDSQEAKSTAEVAPGRRRAETTAAETSRWPEKPPAARRSAEDAPRREEKPQAEETPVRPLRAADESRTETPRRNAEEAPAEEAPRFSLRMPDLSDILPELPLAPAPADEPAAPLWESAEWAQEEAARRDTRGRKTRHDAEHGSVAAKSVLDRLGITATGGGGGRRRADEPGRPESAAEPEAEAKDEPELAPAPRPEEPEPVEEPWLPLLRMPPALDPLSDIDAWTPSEQPFPEGYARAIAEDEPPPDAGLAELLARALAEHQAGTASAAALVKRLGPNDEPKPINGRATADRHRNNGD